MKSPSSFLARSALLRSRALWLPTALLLASCADPDGSDGPAAALPPTVELEQQLVDCGFACGDNGAAIDGVFFWELSLAGEDNSYDVSYSRFAIDEEAMENDETLSLDVMGSRLRARDEDTGLWTEGMALEDGVMELMVRKEGEQVAVPYYVKIVEVHAGSGSGQPYWTKVLGAPEYVETYKLAWKLPPSSGGPTNGVYRDLCKISTAPDDPWRNRLDALVFEGERYDIETKAITSTSAAPFVSWFNIACAGSLPAKMHLARRTSVAQSPPTFNLTIDDDRQAMARMWAADYCGTGRTFTKTGLKLRIRDRQTFSIFQDGWLAHIQPLSYSDANSTESGFRYEAVWGAGGAVCLETPRMVQRSKVEEYCTIPTCTSLPWFPGGWKEHGQFISALPPPALAR